MKDKFNKLIQNKYNFEFTNRTDNLGNIYNVTNCSDASEQVM